MRAANRIFLVDDDELLLSMLSRGLQEQGYEVKTDATGGNVESTIWSWCPDIVLLDIHLPDRNGVDLLRDLKREGVQTPVVMLTADESAETAVQAMKVGAVDYIFKPFEIDEVVIVIQHVLERERLRREVAYLRRVHAETDGHELIGDAAEMRSFRREVQKLAEAGVSTILITGESGTGKELAARYAHQLMHGSDKGNYVPFIRVNCAALPESLLESELFGCEKGSYTDAKADRKGLFELAEDGSILLDEIAEMKLNLQSKLLRVLEERTVRHIGGRHEIPVNATVIITTNRDLDKAVKQGEFRMDLYYRLNAFAITVPPLRERREDIPLLIAHFLAGFTKKYNKKERKRISAEAETLLIRHDWPGNVRELRNVIERIVVLRGDDIVGPAGLPRDISSGHADTPSHTDDGAFILPEGGISLDEVQRSLIHQAMVRANYKKSQAAKLLNMNYDTLRYHVRKLGLG